MHRFGRRPFLYGSALFGAYAAAPRVFASKSASHTHRTQKHAVVIGSGFGGSVAALRLAKAGIETALLERGQHWPYAGPDTYPTTETGGTDDRVSWRSEVNSTSGEPVNLYAGLLERVKGETMDVVVPAGVGGGSLVFGGVLFQPKRELFQQVFPFIDYDRMAETYYPRVISRISGGPIPDDVLESANYASHREMIATAIAAGLETIRHDVCFDWNVIRAELRGELAPAASIGEYVFGCNSNAKNSLDKNYLVEAQDTCKVELLALHNVTDIVRTSAGYEVHCELLTENGSVESLHVIECKLLFLGAGSLNTTKLLLRAKAQGTLPDVHSDVGRYWGNNGDYLVARVGVTAPIGTIQGGPPSVAVFDASSKPLAFSYSPTSRPSSAPIQMHMSMSIPEALGELAYDSAEERIIVRWPFEANAPSHEQYRASTQKLANISGGMVLGEEQLQAPTAWHPLGGAVMGKACSELGEVIGQENLYVIDGSLLPGSAGAANPSLTIAANAERIMEQLIARLT